MLSTINEPNSIFPLYNDYYFEYNSTINSAINFNYRFIYQEYNGSSWVDIQPFDRFANPNGNLKITIRDYLSAKIDSDYFNNHYSLIGISSPTPIIKKFKLKIQEAYAYQFPFVELDSSGVEIGTGVSESSYKINGMYNLKLSYSKVSGDVITPAFQVGSVIEIIDGSDPSIIDPNIGLNGIWTVLEVGVNYVIINAIYDSSHTYYSGSIVWSDRRRVINTDTQYISNEFTYVNNTSLNNRRIQISAPNNYELRSNTKISIPIINIPTYCNLLIYADGVLIETFNDISSNIQFDYMIPNDINTLEIRVYDYDNDNILDSFTFNIKNNCEEWIKKTTLYFLDKSGAFIPFYFDFIKTKSIDITNKNYKTIDELGRSYKFQSDTIKNIKYELNTGFLNEETSIYFEQLYECPYIYVDFDNSGVIQKCLCVDKSTQIITKNNKRLIQYKLNIELSKEEFRQK